MLGIGVRCNPDHSSWARLGRRRILVSLLAVLVALTAALVPRPGLARLLGPGKFSGVVIFDRWDTCILFSGGYSMYISESVKEGLRQYEGQAIQLDATEVVPPMDSNDGLIKKYRVLGPAPDMVSHSAVPTVPEGLVLTIDGPFNNHGLPAVVVNIRNGGKETVQIDNLEIGTALLARKGKEFDYPETLSDGPSTTVVSGPAVVISGQKLEYISGEIKRSFAWEPDNPLPRIFKLAPGQSRGTRITFNLPDGEYQFIFGYGGGAFQARCLTSNKVSFDIPR